MTISGNGENGTFEPCAVGVGTTLTGSGTVARAAGTARVATKQTGVGDGVKSGMPRGKDGA